MNFYEDNLELVGFIAAAFDFPPEMLDHLIKTIPDGSERCERIIQLCMAKYVIGNKLALPENATRFIAEEAEKGFAFLNAFLSYALLRHFEVKAGNNYTKH